MERSTTEVLHDHLARRLDGNVDADIRVNYADDVLILSGFGTFRGKDGVRQSAQELAEAVTGSRFAYNRTAVEGEYAFLEWTASDADTKVCDGADAFHIRDGRIVFQSVHFTTWPR